MSGSMFSLGWTLCVRVCVCVCVRVYLCLCLCLCQSSLLSVSLGLCNAGVPQLDDLLVVLLGTNTFVGGVVGFVLDNTIPGAIGTSAPNVL